MKRKTNWKVASPNVKAKQFLAKEGIDYEKVANQRGGITKEQLKILDKAARHFNSPSLIDNARQTIVRLSGSKVVGNVKGEKGATESRAEIYARNLDDTIEGTLTAAIGTAHLQSLGDAKIQWLPSSAEEQDHEHMKNYGKFMPASTALSRGLTTRYGCKCSYKYKAA